LQKKVSSLFEKILSRRKFLVIGAAGAVAIVAAVLFAESGNKSTSTTQISPSSDYDFFVAPWTAQIESIRSWLMLPISPEQIVSGIKKQFGYDSTYGMIRGGHWPNGTYCGLKPAYRNGFVLIDNNLLLGRSLDYLNAQAGITTSIEANCRMWLSQTWQDPCSPETPTYNGQDRREILFGKTVSCVYTGGTQTWYLPGHTATDLDPITSELPGNGVSQCATISGPFQLESFVPYIELNFLQGNISTAQTLFMETVDGWSSNSGGGYNGSVGGNFSTTLDPLSSSSGKASVRSLALWLHCCRATGFWKGNTQVITMAQQVMNELWSNWTGPGGPMDGGTPESNGETILAFDSRVPSWFGQQSATT
jgi:hypothetical protein